jgi:hypothetical protein
MSRRDCERGFHADEIAFIRHLIAEDPARIRAELSRLTCRALQWQEADGGLKDMSAQVAILRMYNDGLIELPAPRCKRPDQPVRISSRSDPGQPLDQPARALASPALQRVYARNANRASTTSTSSATTTSDTSPFPRRSCALSSPRANSPSPCSASAPAQRIAGSAHRQDARTTQTQKRKLHLIVNNAIFLLLPWQSKHLASMILAKAAVSSAPLENRACRSKTYGSTPLDRRFRETLTR